jgi:hypothetical protein
MLAKWRAEFLPRTLRDGKSATARFEPLGGKQHEPPFADRKTEPVFAFTQDRTVNKPLPEGNAL